MCSHRIRHLIANCNAVCFNFINLHIFTHVQIGNDSNSVNSTEKTRQFIAIQCSVTQLNSLTWVIFALHYIHAVSLHLTYRLAVQSVWWTRGMVSSSSLSMTCLILDSVLSCTCIRSLCEETCTGHKDNASLQLNAAVIDFALVFYCYQVECIHLRWGGKL